MTLVRARSSCQDARAVEAYYTRYHSVMLEHAVLVDTRKKHAPVASSYWKGRLFGLVREV